MIFFFLSLRKRFIVNTYIYIRWTYFVLFYVVLFVLYRLFPRFSFPRVQPFKHRTSIEQIQKEERKKKGRNTLTFHGMQETFCRSTIREPKRKKERGKKKRSEKESRNPVSEKTRIREIAKFAFRSESVSPRVC